MTITGTASDTGGGVVAGVEVSTDGGTTWHPVTTMSTPSTSVTWSYTSVANRSPSTTIESRAVDDSGNLETPADGVTAIVSCPCSIWGDGTTPGTIDSGDTASIKLGVKFTTDTPGFATGVRFYKAAANTGTHIGDLWTASRPAARERYLHQRDGIRLAAGEFRAARAAQPGHDLCRVLLRAQRALLPG